jgi:hypothetical protein
MLATLLGTEMLVMVVCPENAVSPILVTGRTVIVVGGSAPWPPGKTVIVLGIVTAPPFPV